MLRKLSWLILAGVALAGPRLESEPFQWRGRVETGALVQVNGVRGDIRVEAALGDEVEIIARLRGEADEVGQVGVEVVEHSGGVTVCAVYPSENPNQPYQCRPPGRPQRRLGKTEISGDRASLRFPDGSGGVVRWIEVRIDFTVRVPAGVRFQGRTAEGEVMPIGSS